jgi:hypothetical protein
LDGATVVPIADLVSTKSAEENAQGGENGAKRMAAAAAGELSKRGPITVMPAEQGGKFEVVDGSGTLTSVSKYGWKSLPVMVVSRADGLRMMAEDAAKDAAKAVAAYDYKRDNFKPPAPADVFEDQLLQEVNGYLAKFFKEKPEYQMSPEDRARGEALLAPRMDLARQAKAEYDAKVLAIVKQVL